MYPLCCPYGSFPSTVENPNRRVVDIPSLFVCFYVSRVFDFFSTSLCICGAYAASFEFWCIFVTAFFFSLLFLRIQQTRVSQCLLMYTYPLNYIYPPRVCVVCFLFLFYLSVYVYFARWVFRVLFHIHKQLFFSNSICSYVTMSIHVHKTFRLYLSSCPPKHLFICACLRQDCSINLKIKRIARHWQFRTHMSKDLGFF